MTTATELLAAATRLDAAADAAEAVARDMHDDSPHFAREQSELAEDYRVQADDYRDAAHRLLARDVLALGDEATARALAAEVGVTARTLAELTAWVSAGDLAAA